MEKKINTEIRNSTLNNPVFNYGNKKINKILGMPPFMPEVFLGREADLTDVHKKLFEENNLLLLVNGEGGIGKTTLAAKYYQKYHNDYAHLAWVFAETSLIEALLTLAFPLGISFDDKMPEPERFNVLLSEMANLKEPCLLVVDNANNLAELEIYYGKLRTCRNFHILLTTRVRELSSAKTHYVGHLDKATANELFTRHYPAHCREEDTLLEAVLEATGYNTLVIELLAKTLNHSNQYRKKYPLSGLLNDLTQKGLFGLSESPVVETLYHSSGALRKEKPEAILAAMYSLSTLSESETALLSVFAVLPAENILFETLADLLPNIEKVEDNLTTLHKKGWIEFDKQGKSFKCSPVVQETVRSQNKANLFAHCLPMIDTLVEKFDYETGTGHLININYQTVFLYARYAESIVKYTNKPNYEIGLLSDKVGLLYENTGSWQKAKTFFEHSILFFKNILAVHPNEEVLKNALAISYQHLANTYIMCGEIKDSIALYAYSYKISKELYIIHPERVEFIHTLSITYSKLGDLYTLFGKINASLSLYKKFSQLSNKLHESQPNNNEFKNALACSYSRLGESFESLGKIEEALQNFNLFNQLMKELHAANPKHREFKNGLAISYSKLGGIYFKDNNYNDALIIYKHFNQIIRQLSKENPETVNFKNNLALSYEKIGEVYRLLKDNKKALTYFKIENKLFRKFNQAHPEQFSLKKGLAISYQHLGITHLRLENKYNALDNFEQYHLLEKELHEKHPDVISIKNGLAISYQHLGITNLSLENKRKALDDFEQYHLLEKELHETYPEQVSFKNGLAVSLSNLGKLNISLKNAEKGKTYLEQAEQLLRELVEKHPAIVEYQNNLSWVKEELAKLK